MGQSRFHLKLKWKFHIPIFYKEIMNSNKIIDEKNTELLKQNWLTDDLVKEIESNFLTQSEIVDDKRDHDASSVKDDKLFAKGRQLLSYKKLYQSARTFQEAWSSNLHMEYKCTCFYSRSNKARDNIVLP